MRSAEDVLFSRGGIDRAAHLRSEPAMLAALASRGDARAVAYWRGKALVACAEPIRPGWLAPDHPVFAEHGGERVFLGLENGAARFAIDVSSWDDPEADGESLGRFADATLNRHPLIGADLAFAELRANMAVLDAEGAGVAATARGILGWHASHRFCARCGAATTAAEAGWRRICPACGAHHFPRTDPAVMMLVTHGERVLLGRQPGWAEGMYSLLAGFVEPGESLEAAVRRETMEEAGIAIGRVHYLASQPWPFPSSLMIGCAAEALGQEIHRDPGELEAARWATREEVVEGLAGRDAGLKPARAGSIAHFLLAAWVADRLA